MRPSKNADCGLRIADWAPLAAVVLLSCLALTVWADTPAERGQRLAELSPEQKEDLLRKKQRFDALDDAEKQRLRDLHAQLSAAPDAPQLHGVLVRYSTWLKGLQPAVRAEVTNTKLPSQQRIERIKEIVRKQEGQRFSEFVNYNLPPEDQEKIYQWLDKFVEDNEKQMLDAVRDDRDRRWIRNIDDDRVRRRMLITRMGFRRHESKVPFPSQEQIEQMVASLSDSTRQELAKTVDPNIRQDRANELIGAAIFSISFPQPTEDELRKFYAALPAEKLSHLENLDPDDLQTMLRKMWRMEQFKERGGPRGSSPRGDGPRGSRPGSPPPSLNQPPGFANPAPANKKK